MRRAKGLAKTRPFSCAAAGTGAAFAAGAGAGSVFGSGGTGGVSRGAPPAGGGLPANFSNSAGSSPSSSKSAIGWLTLMPCAPSGTMILPSRPSSAASYSIVALSVSISAMTSPECTASPSFFSQRARLPSVIVGDSAGIRISIGMMSRSATSFAVMPAKAGMTGITLAVRHLAGGGDDVLDLRHGETFQIGGVRQWHVLAGDALQWRVEPVEALFHDDRGDLGADPGERPALLDRDDAVGFLDRRDDRLDIERPQRAQIDDFRRDPHFLELLGGLHRELHHARECGDRDLVAGAGDARLADRHEEFGIFRHRETLAIHEFMFEKDHRVGIADRRFQEPLVVGAGIGRYDLDPGDMRIPARKALRMLRGDPRGDAV